MVALILGIVSLVVAIASVTLVFAVERARKPRIAI